MSMTDILGSDLQGIRDGELGEDVLFTDEGTEKCLRVVWIRKRGDGVTDQTIGIVGYTGEAMAVVHYDDMPDAPGPRAKLTRNGEEWIIRRAEPRRDNAWLLHLGKANESRMPTRVRK
jgi:hypothetical protein